MNVSAALPAPSRRVVVWSGAAALSLALALLSSVAPPLLVAALPLAAGAGVAILRWPWLAPALLLASVPVQQLGAVGPLTLTRASMPLALLGYVVALTLQRRPLAGSVLLLPGAALLGWMVWSTRSATDTDAALADVFRWLVALVALALFVQLLATDAPRMARLLVLTMALAGAAEAAVGTALGVLGVGPESFAVGTAFARAFGTFGRPNTFAGYLEMAVFPVLWLGLYQLRLLLPELRAYRLARGRGFVAATCARHSLLRSAVLPLVLCGATLVMLAGIGASYSRGAWLGVAAGLAVSGLVALRRHWLLPVAAAPIALLVVVGGVAQIVPPELSQRLGSIVDEARPFDAASVTITDDNFATAERMAHWQAGWHMFEDNPLDGVGPGNFNARYPAYFVRTEFRHSQGHAHNFYIHMLAENGIVGLALYLTLAGGFVLLALRVALGAGDGLAGALALGALGTMAAVGVHSLFENLHVLNLSVQLAACWALALAAERIWRSAPAGSRVEYSGA